MFAVVVVATSFTLANGPVHEALASGHIGTHVLVYAGLVLLAISLFVSLSYVLGAMEPTLPSSVRDERAWTKLIDHRRRTNRRAGLLIGFNVSFLVLLWFVDYVPLVS